MYQAAAEQIRRIYKKCVEEGKELHISIADSLEKSSQNQPWAASEGGEEGLIRDALKPDGSGGLSVKQCATVARCLIQAWTNFVRIVDWDEGGVNGKGAMKDNSTQTENYASGTLLKADGEGLGKEKEREQEAKNLRSRHQILTAFSTSQGRDHSPKLIAV